MLKLTKNINQSIPVSQMKGGDVAVIVGWAANAYVGQVVQRYKQHLITLGANIHWSDYFDNFISTSCRVRILESGETLTVE